MNPSPTLLLFLALSLFLFFGCLGGRPLIQTTPPEEAVDGLEEDDLPVIEDELLPPEDLDLDDENLTLG